MAVLFLSHSPIRKIEESSRLETLLGDDLPEMCDLALTLAAGATQEAICSVVEDTNASLLSRSVALGALHLQVRLGYRTHDELITYLLELFERSEALAGGAWFWSDVADIGAHLSVSEMLPLLHELVRAEVFVEPDGTVWTDDEGLKEQFANPRPLPELPDLTTLDALYLFGRCSGHESMTVADFIGRLVPLNYAEAVGT